MPLLAESIDGACSDRLTTTSTNGTSHLMVVHLAIWLTLVLEISASVEALVAVEAGEVLWMPFGTHGVDVLTSDGLATSSTLEREGCVETTLTEGLSLSFQEPAGQRLQASAADKVLWMPLLSECCDASVCDGLVTVCAAWTEQCLPAVCTVCTALALIERGCSERSPAGNAHKVLRMPHATKSLDDLSENGLSTGTTDASAETSSTTNTRSRPSVSASQSAHVALKVGHEAVELVSDTCSGDWSADRSSGSCSRSSSRGRSSRDTVQIAQ